MVTAMLVHGDFSFSDLCALTRERRREELCHIVMMAFPAGLERAYERVHGLGAKPPKREDNCLRFSDRSVAAAFPKRVWRGAKKPHGKDHSTLAPMVFKALWLLQAGCCYRCDEPFTPDDWATVDHVVPRSKGGADGGNILLACAPCNQEKADRDPTPAELAVLARVNEGFLGAYEEVERGLALEWAA